MRIYFGDLVHTWEKVSVWTIPLNVGFVAAYAGKHFPDAKITIFKDPNELLESVRNCRPDVVALSSYAWNENLTSFVLKKIKAHDPSILTVEGGPVFTVLNSNAKDAAPYFEKHAACDVFIVDQGELPMVDILNRWLAVDHDPVRLRKETVRSVITNDLADSGELNIGTPMGNIIDELDDIPSPYLTGLMDPYLEKSFIPLLETNRSCPYQCTFCTLGVATGSKLKTFGLDRVLAEIDYIAEKTKADYLITTDANFGILDRDAEIAAHFYKSNVTTNFPGHLCVVWNKSRPDRVMRAARAFNGLAQVGASMQSMQPEVLKAIRRKNLPIEIARKMSEELQKDDVGFFSELIAGLPEQTFDGHIEDIKTLMGLGANIYNYGLRLLLGTLMNSDESRKKYVRKSGWRLQVDAFGVYEGEPVFEGEEMVLETSTMSENEIHELRLIHFLLQYMWGKRYFYEYVHLFRVFDIDPMDVILATARALRTAASQANNGPVGKVFRDYEKDHHLERFTTYQDMCDYWSEAEPLKRLYKGDAGKLNSYHALNLLFILDDFMVFLSDSAKSIIGKRWNEAEPLFKEVLRFSRENFVDVNTLHLAPLSKRRTFAWDIVGWSEANYDPALPLRSLGGNFVVEFYRQEKNVERLKKSIQFFTQQNDKGVLRTLFDTNSAFFRFDFRSESKIAAAE